MDELLPGKKKFTRWNEKGQIIGRWEAQHLDWTARVVCLNCNNTWMSDIESQHAKPAMTDLIVGKLDIPISESRARSLAVFAFKTAVIFDHIQRNRPPFFLSSSRHRFAKSLVIPFGVSMWLSGFLPFGHGDVSTTYHEGQLSPTNRLKLYVCTYSVGHLALQVVAQRQQGFTPFLPQRGFAYLAIPFWPKLRAGASWPPHDVLRTRSDFEGLATRWTNITFRR